MARDLIDVSLDDKYTHDRGRILISGVQALIRLPMLQRDRDAARGYKTAGFISGYRGSPLGGLDSAAFREADRLKAHDITFLPAVNEDLAASSAWGTQQIDALPGAKVEGVFAMWYGKGPGVERSTDAIHHGNYAGTHEKGGVLLVYGDDHSGKSSTSAHQSEQTLAALSVPSLYPADVEEFLRFGLLGWEMSRFTGLWVGFKCVNETVEQTATVSLDAAGADIVVPDRNPDRLPPQGVNINPRFFGPAEVEQVVQRYRLPLVHDFVRANRIDRVAKGAAQPGIGIVAAGKSYKDVCRALELLGLDAARMTAARGRGVESRLHLAIGAAGHHHFRRAGRGAPVRRGQAPGAGGPGARDPLRRRPSPGDLGQDRRTGQPAVPVRRRHRSRRDRPRPLTSAARQRPRRPGPRGRL